MEARVAKVEQAIASLQATASHLATKTWVTVAIGTAIALVVGSLLTVMLYLHGDLKSVVQAGFSSMNERISGLEEQTVRLREDVAYLKGRDDPDTKK